MKIATVILVTVYFLTICCFIVIYGYSSIQFAVFFFCRKRLKKPLSRWMSVCISWGRFPVLREREIYDESLLDPIWAFIHFVFSQQVRETRYLQRRDRRKRRFTYTEQDDLCGFQLFFVEKCLCCQHNSCQFGVIGKFRAEDLKGLCAVRLSGVEIFEHKVPFCDVKPIKEWRS